MPSTFDYAYVQQYDNVLNLSFQQMDSYLLKTVTLDKMAATTKYFERLGVLSAPMVRSSRIAPVVLEDPTFSRRLLTATSYEKALAVDSIDKMRINLDPTSDLVKDQMAAFHRQIDDTIIAAATGNALTSTTVNSSVSSVAFLSANIVPVGYDEPGTGQSGNTGLTVGKVKQARNILYAKEAIMPGEELFLIANTPGINQLLRDPQVTNIFYQDAKPLVEGAITSKFLGMTVIRSERLPIITGNQVGALVYPASALKFSWLEALHGRIDLRPDLQGETYQLKAMASFAAVRMWEEKVSQIVYDTTL